MPKVKSLKDPNRLFFACPGCQADHCVRIGGDGPTVWGYNGNPDAPTFTPSILVRGTQPLTEDEYQQVMAHKKVEKRPLVCHSFVTDGRIQFLGDCTHALAGQTVDIPDWETA